MISYFVKNFLDNCVSIINCQVKEESYKVYLCTVYTIGLDR